VSPRPRSLHNLDLRLRSPARRVIILAGVYDEKARQMPIEADKVPKAGATAPEFELSDSDGRLRRLSELTAERDLVLVFFRGHW